MTGGNKGIGYFIVRRLLKSGIDPLQCIFTSRTEANGKKAIESLAKDGVDNRRVHFHVLDLSRPESVETFSKWIAAKHPKIDIVVNNAGFAFKNSDRTPFSGQAAPTFAINFFGTVALTEKLRPFLAPNGRIVNVASMAGTGAIGRLKNTATKQCLSQSKNLATLMASAQAFVDLVTAKGKKCADEGFPTTCYGMSKAFLIAYTRLCARGGVNTFSCCPGWCATDMSSHSGPRSADKGAETPVWLALQPLTKLQSGAMYSDMKEMRTGLGPLK